MSSIIGIQGLEPTFKIIKFTKNIAIANKESIICGWNLINRELNKYETNFIPVDLSIFLYGTDCKIKIIKVLKKFISLPLEVLSLIDL